MEEGAPPRPSVAELAGRFKGSAPAPDAAGQETEKPVRRRPPHSLQLHKTSEDDKEPPGVTSPLPSKAKRNSALIEKLQANLALSPTALLPSPKSPGFRLLPPAFTPPSPSSAPVAGATTSSTPTPTSPVAASPLTEEEGPSSFEAPPTVGEGTILSNDSIKGRARHSIRRRPPSRRHRKSSSEDDVNHAGGGGGEEGGGGGQGGEKDEKGEVLQQEGQTSEVTEDQTDATESSEKIESSKEDQPQVSSDPTEEDKEKEERGVEEMVGEERGGGPAGVEEGEGSPSRGKEEEEETIAEQQKVTADGATLSESKEEEKTEATNANDQVR